MRFSLSRPTTQPSTFAQVVPWLLPGDGLSNDALAIAAQLAAHGMATLHSDGPVHPGLATLVTPGPPPPEAHLLVHVDERMSVDPRPREPSPALRGRTLRSSGRTRGRSRLARLHSLRSSGAALTGFDVVLANSSWTAQRAVDRGAAICAVVPTFLPLDGFGAARQKRSDDAPHDATIVSVGPFRTGDRLTRSVMIDHIVRTHMNSEARLVAVGRCLDPGLERAVSMLCDEFRLGSPWRRHLGHDAYVREVALAGVLLHDAEDTAFGSAMVEAMAAGTPVVACAGGATAETLGGAGILLPGDAPATVVAEAVHAALSDGALRRQLSAAGRERAEQLAPATCAALLDRELHALGWW